MPADSGEFIKIRTQRKSASPNYSELTDSSKPAKSGYTISDNFYKVIKLDNGAEKFYDLTIDPYEQNNIPTRNQTSTQKSAKNNLLTKVANIRI